MDLGTWTDNLTIALSPLVIGGMTVAVGGTLVGLCVTSGGQGCAVAAPLLGTATVGGAWATWRTAEEVWFSSDRSDHYRPLGGRARTIGRSADGC